MWRNGLDCVKNGLKMGGIVPLEHPKRSNIFFGEPQDLFRKNTFSTKVCDGFGHKLAHFRGFGTLEGPQRLTLGSKSAHFPFVCTPNGPLSPLGKHIYGPFLTDFWSQNGPF